MHEGAERSKQSNTHALSTDARSVQTYTQGRGKARARGGGGGTPGCPATWAAEYRPYIRQGGTSARRTRWACRSPCTSPPTVIVPCCHPPPEPRRAHRVSGASSPLCGGPPGPPTRVASPPAAAGASPAPPPSLSPVVPPPRSPCARASCQRVARPQPPSVRPRPRPCGRICKDGYHLAIQQQETIAGKQHPSTACSAGFDFAAH